MYTVTNEESKSKSKDGPSNEEILIKSGSAWWALGRTSWARPESSTTRNLKFIPVDEKYSLGQGI